MHRERGRRAAREALTDVYICLIFTGFLLFPGGSGYANITISKYVFFLAATGVWLICAAALSPPLSRPAGARSGRLCLQRRFWTAPQGAAALLFGAMFLSWLHSPWRGASFLGAGRWDGLLSQALYLLAFWGVSAFTHPKQCHAAALCIGVALCCAVGTLQVFGLDPLRLFPGDLNFYDRGTLYSGAYLGTVGNTNVLDAVLCVSLPCLLALWLRDGDWLCLLPLPFAAFVLASAGGSGAAIALGACALWGLPRVAADPVALRRGLRCAPLLLFPGALALLWQPEYAGRRLIPRLLPSLPAAALLLAALAALLLSCAPWFPLAPSRRWRRGFLPLCYAVAGAVGLALLWFWPGDAGALYELSRSLHGKPEDSFGSSRILIWRNCLALVPERPLLGGGPGTLSLRLDVEFSRYVPETGQTLRAFVDNAHSVYLGMLVNCGVLGLGCYLLLLGLALRKGRGTALRAGVLCACVHNCFGLGLVLSEPLFWILLGLLCGGGGDLPG